MTLKPLLLFLCSACALPLMAQKNYTLTSPAGTLQAAVAVGSDLRLSLAADGQTILAPSPVAMTLAGGETLGATPKVTKIRKSSADETIASPFYKKTSVRDRYNELTLSLRGDYGLTVRLYDDGLAYRFTTRKKDKLFIENELAAFNFPADYTAYAPYVARGKSGDFESQFFNSFENTYTRQPLTKLDPGRLIFLPMLVELPGGRKMVITEADLAGYPGLYLNASAEAPQLKGVFAPYPKTLEQGGHNRLQMLVTGRENYIAATEGTRSFPWRVVIVSKDDSRLLDNDMVYRLAPASKIADTSWIKPGKVAWDWWNAWNLYGVGFRAGINNDTYKYYIQFAADHGLEYVILDEGWAVNKQADLMQVIPEIDLPELVEYARQRNVGIILWAGYHTFDRDMEQVVKHYADMGVKGFKVDFMDRDDQPMVDFLHRAAEVCAEHRMLLDYHGIFKPTGLGRTWPNVLNYEGVFGLEQLKWSPATVDMVTYDVTMPFIRMVAGPMDYTQGAMRNAAKNNYRPVNSEANESGHPLPPAGRVHRFRIADHHALRLAFELPAGNRVFRIHRRDSDRLGRNRGPQGFGRRIHRHRPPFGRHVVCRRDDRLVAARTGTRPVVPSRRQLRGGELRRRHQRRPCGPRLPEADRRASAGPQTENPDGSGRRLCRAHLRTVILRPFRKGGPARDTPNGTNRLYGRDTPKPPDGPKPPDTPVRPKSADQRTSLNVKKSSSHSRPLLFWVIRRSVRRLNSSGARIIRQPARQEVRSSRRPAAGYPRTTIPRRY